MAETVSKEILIVEDSPTQAEKLRHSLERQGYRVVAAASGEEALAAICRRRPALIVSDIVMPEMDGFALCRKIKCEWRDIPVILLTSLSDSADVLRAFECGADIFITKPFDGRHDTLLDRLRLLERETTSLSDVPEARTGIALSYKGQQYLITAERRQILDFLLSTYETAIKQNDELKEARLQLKEWNARLEEEVEERTAALVAEIEERKKAQEEIRRLNVELEQRVAERTRELEAANRELESFVYSVSHDLRAPLRHIAAYSQTLEEEKAGSLDDIGLEYLGRIRGATRNMHDLIEALLRLSRLSRSELNLVRVNLSDLVRAKIEELQREEPERRVETVVADGLTAYGDPEMLKTVIDNLLRNAWKFSGGKPETRIEFGAGRKDDKTVFWVRDNGAGFNMDYASGLFLPFHRLHSAAEFPGIGIGLATVQRIVQRHGGSIWADGEKERGATFYFTLN